MKFLNRYGWILLAAVASVFFARSFLPGMVLFSNDIPNAVVHADYYQDASSVMGMWMNLNWAGVPSPAAPLSGHTLLVFLLGPVGYSKFAGMLATLFMGWSGWFYFRRVGFDGLLSLVGGLALMLNMTFLCFTAWGVFAWNLAIGFTFIVLGILHQDRYTAKDLIAAGLCTGMCVNDGTDVGAILAAFIGVYFLFRNLPRSWKASLKAGWQLGVIVALALLASSNRVYSLVEIIISGVASEATTEQSKAEQWNFITQWSLPKKELAGMVVPGLFGYRMDSPDGGLYWGEVGRSPGWQGGPNGARFSGGGQYVGKAVLLVALLSVVAVFIPRLRGLLPLQSERREIYFWSAVCLVTFTFILGKFFFTYRLVYALPFFSSIRNPVKFIVPFMIGLMILFGHGLRLLTAKNKPAYQKLLLRVFLGIAGVFVLFHVILLAFWAGSRDKILGYLSDNAFDAATRNAIYDFSQGEIVLSFLLLLATGALLVFCLRAKSKAGPLLALAALLVVDLGWAGQHWIKYYNSQARYQSNPVLDVLRDKPYEHRVAGPQNGSGVFYLMAVVHQQSEQAQQWVRGISQFYDVEWLQHHFQYYNIQSPDIVQWPRMPIMDGKFRGTFGPKAGADGRLDISATLRTALRFWELTNTRYLLASTPSFQALQAFFTNSQFRLVKTFEVTPNGDYFTAQQTTNGSLALIEFSNALPRVKFYSRWRTEPDEDKALALVAGDLFNPAREVVVVTNDVSGIKPGEPGAASEAAITAYGPKKYAIRLTNAAPGVLLLNSRYDPNWRVTVDGQPQPLLRCNFLMSGVAVPAAGKHEVVFRYAPDLTLFYVNAASIVVLLLLLVVPSPKRKAAPSTASTPRGKLPQ